MKIELLRVSNFKKLKDVEIAPEKNVIVIGGNNGEGKSSVLDAIQTALQGYNYKDLKKPIREGETNAEIILEIDNFIVRRHWTSNERSYLTITDKDTDAKYESPQKMLDKFTGKLSFDPLEFTRIKEKDQTEVLLSALGLKEKVEEADSTIKDLYERRADINRTKKTYEGFIGKHKEDLKLLPEPPKEKPDIASINRAVKDAIAKNSKYDEIVSQIEDRKEEILRYRDEIARLEETIKNYGIYLAENPKEDVELLELKEVEAMKQVSAYDLYSGIKETEARIKDFDDQAKKLTTAMAEKEKEKRDLLDTAPLPVKGLGIADDGTLQFKGVPFNQVSASEQLKVSIAIAKVLNPELKVIRIIDGSLLDDISMATIEAFAKKYDYQIWVERVGRDRFTEIIMVDGEATR